MKVWHSLSSKKGIKTLDLLVKKQDLNYVKIHIIDNGIGRENQLF